MAEDSGYGRGKTGAEGEIPAPDLPYQPRDPENYRPAIGLVGCGGISEMHLRAYQNAGYNVAALCSRDRERVEGRRDLVHALEEFRGLPPPQLLLLEFDCLRTLRHMTSQYVRTVHTYVRTYLHYVHYLR